MQTPNNVTCQSSQGRIFGFPGVQLVHLTVGRLGNDRNPRVWGLLDHIVGIWDLVYNPAVAVKKQAWFFRCIPRPPEAPAQLFER